MARIVSLTSKEKWVIDLTKPTKCEFCVSPTTNVVVEGEATSFCCDKNDCVAKAINKVANTAHEKSEALFHP